MLDARQLEHPLTEKEQLLRDHFVSQYLVDFDAFKACLRLGFQPTFATVHCNVLLNDGYVQRKLAFLRAKPVTPEQDAILKAECEETLRVVMHRGSDSARVAAVREFNAMKGWSKPDVGATGEQGLIEVMKQLAQRLPD